MTERHSNSFKPGDLVNTPNGPGIVAGHSALRIFVAPTGQDPPYSSKLAYCDAWSAGRVDKTRLARVHYPRFRL